MLRRRLVAKIKQSKFTLPKINYVTSLRQVIKIKNLRPSKRQCYTVNLVNRKTFILSLLFKYRFSKLLDQKNTLVASQVKMFDIVKKRSANTLFKSKLTINNMSISRSSLSFVNFVHAVYAKSRKRFNFMFHTVFDNIVSISNIKKSKSKHKKIKYMSEQQKQEHIDAYINERTLQRENIFMHSNFSDSKRDLISIINKGLVNFNLKIVKKFPFSKFMPIRMEMVNE